jgi:hypothetical protein
MADLAVIVPSRGRPRQLRELVDAIHDTAVTDLEVYVGVDVDDPTRAEYTAAAVFTAGQRLSLSQWTNALAEQVLDGPNPPRYLASMGDDHRPRTKGWDRRLIGAIDSLGDAPGIAYGDDRYQGAALPTAWVVSADLVRAVGWMMLPACAHLYVDNAVLALGQATGRILYCPDVVIEHMHPAAGKAELDDSYRQSNARERYAADRAAFEAWRDGGGLAGDAAKVVAGATTDTAA